jgi:putative flavoprotein involved in K+ transport
MAADGIRLIGRIQAVEGERARLAGDLLANVVRAERFFDDRFRDLIERYIEAAGLDVPPDDRTTVDFEPPSPAELDFARAGISTVIWASGYGLDFGWIEAPIFDEWGLPRTSEGVAEVPGLYFLGMPWQGTMLSATLVGLPWDAARLADRMGLTE